MLINQTKCKAKVVFNYVNYLLDRLAREINQPKLYGINLKHDDLLRKHNLIKEGKYYKGFIPFMLKHGVITCVKENFNPGKEARLYSVNLLNLCNVMNEICKQSRYDFELNDCLIGFIESNIKMTPLVQAFCKHLSLGRQAIYKEYSFDSCGVVYKKGKKEKHISENTFLVRYLGKLEEHCPPIKYRRTKEIQNVTNYCR